MKRIPVLTTLTALLALWTMAVFGLVPSEAEGAVPQLINFQGILRNGSGNPVADGSYSVIFTIYDAPAGGTVQWAETTSVATTGGLFTVLLGSLNPVPDSAFNNPDRWLGVKVGADPEMTPRQQLVSVAYSLRVAHFIPNFGTNNTFIGENAGNLTMTGGKNTAIGDSALQSNTTGNNNTASGTSALLLNTTGGGNTANGYQALFGNTTGGSNTAIGQIALGSNATGNSNTAIGSAALLSNTTGTGNTASGANALAFNTIGEENTANGLSALLSNTTGTGNTASGARALAFNTTGFGNTASGFSALVSNTTGFHNTAIGDSALLFNTSGFRNTASGAFALQGNTTGVGNTASGVFALQSNTIGLQNTASGNYALFSNTTGNYNTASGAYALEFNTTGSSNTAIGVGADVSAGNLTNATAIGAGATVNASNKIRLGNSAVTVIEGQVAYTFPSDKNQKENFRPVDGEEVLRKIRGFDLSSWNYKGHDPKQFRHYGPVAQDFFAAFGDDGVGKIGTETTLNSGDMAGILMIAVQALGNENADLKARIEHLEERLAAMQAEKPQAKIR